MITIHILEKPKSRQRIEIVHADDDDWFINVNYVEKKSGKLASQSMIIRPDLKQRLSRLERIGWKEVKR